MRFMKSSDRQQGCLREGLLVSIPPSPFSRGRSGPAGFPSPLSYPARQLRPGI